MGGAYTPAPPTGPRSCAHSHRVCAPARGLGTCGVQCFEELWWRWCVRLMERSGALFIKLAQWSSSRPDIFGARVCQRFAHLQDSTPAHSWAESVRVLDRALGAGWREYLELETTPIGSGCIAQVYRGRLRVPAAADGAPGDGDGWREVAVKVVHPTVDEAIEIDMDLLLFVGAALDASPTLRWLSPASMVEEFSGMLLKQLDLRIEA